MENMTKEQLIEACETEYRYCRSSYYKTIMSNVLDFIKNDISNNKDIKEIAGMQEKIDYYEQFIFSLYYFIKKDVPFVIPQKDFSMTPTIMEIIKVLKEYIK